MGSSDRVTRKGTIMLSQYAGLEYGLDDRAVHDAVLGDFDTDDVGRAAPAGRSRRAFRTEFVGDAVGDAVSAGE